MVKSINREQANELWMELYIKKGRGWLPVLTSSMAPLIHPGDQVLVSKAIAEQIRFGDIIVFRRDGDMVVHRVLKKWRLAEGIHFSEKGDSTDIYGVINADNIIGRVIVVKGRHKMLNLSSPFSRLVSFALSVWFCSTTAIVTIVKSSKGKNIRRIGKVLSPLLFLSSNVWVRICCVIWYLSALLARRRA